MKNESITGGFQKLKQDLAGMTFRDKCEHLWTYYRSWVIVACAIVMVISILCTSFINLTTNTLVAGVSLNAVMQSDAKEYMSEQLQPLLATGNGREKAYMEITYISDSLEETYYLQQNMQALIAAQDLDYMILDKAGLDLLMPFDPFMDLREVFTAEELEALTVHNVQASETAEAIPTLIDISDLPIIKNPGSKKIFFVIIGNTERLDAVKAAFAHLQNYGK
jgi:hypothetical protein